ncbi:hypothetical protein BVX97_06450 [bacterium E08(2017)]|nr:hypothetical protein BVX97_06450 [bacterium E08(2017)]
MDMTFTVDEVFEMAEQIERNGGIFYREAAEIMKDADAKAKLLDLAEAEDRHEVVFRGLRENLVPENARLAVYDLDNVVALYLQALASREIFVVGQKAEDVLKGDETFEEIVKMAIGKEWDSILYYTAVRELVKDDDGRKAVDEVIMQEEKHVKDLQACL